MIEQLFFQLICVAIGTQDRLLRAPSGNEWKMLYDMAKKQSLVGICFAGVQRLVNSEKEDYCGMPEMLYLTWMGMAAKIQQRNEQMNKYTKDALAYFREQGIGSCVLKGQGVASLYGSLAGLRQSGDVDLWANCSRDKLYRLSLKEFGRIEGLTYHHIHYPKFEDCEVEAHTWPSFLTNPMMNNRFQKFCSQYAPISGCQDTPSLAFNRVFILQHCYGHFCGHGVGFRQLLDYYFVLKQGFSEEERLKSMAWIKKLGIGRFAAALMWLCVEVFGMNKTICICEPNEKDGKFLLAEVMLTGNMGHQDERVDQKKIAKRIGKIFAQHKA